MPPVWIETEVWSWGSCTSGTRRLKVVLPVSTVMTSVMLTIVPIGHSDDPHVVVVVERQGAQGVLIDGPTSTSVRATGAPNPSG